MASGKTPSVTGRPSWLAPVPDAVSSVYDILRSGHVPTDEQTAEALRALQPDSASRDVEDVDG